MSEFTGERVIPGQVDTDLWNEHFSRYAFASGLVAGKRVLDLGCGSGYGSAELARTAESVTGVDIGVDAIEYAKAHFKLPNLTFLKQSCTQLAQPDAGFQFITAFEVIEHLDNWRDMLGEARRVLSPGGEFLVSTPNKLYYTEQRRQAGPNPFHQHEFEFEEFKQALSEFFPRVDMLLQNRTEAFVYAGLNHQLGSLPDGRDSEVPLLRLESSQSNPAGAHFFLALCGGLTLTRARAFVFIPTAANLLRERELHIDRLTSEVGLKNQWLTDMTGQRDQLQTQHDTTLTQLEERARWAQALEAELDQTRQRVVNLQEEFAQEQQQAKSVTDAYAAKVRELEKDVTEKANWALDTERRLTAELEAKQNELVEAVRLLDQAEATVEERTRWAQNLNQRLQSADAQLAMIRASRWIKLGRKAGLGPRFD